MVGIYLSGTGNTKYCVEKLLEQVDKNTKVIALEEEEAVQEIRKNDVIYLGYPIQFSNAPYMVQEFIKKHGDLWKDKKVFCIATMGGFSGDGAGCSARLLKRYGAEILGGLHIKMPDSVCDSKLLKKPIEKNRQIIREAEEKISHTANLIKQGKYPQDGLSFISYVGGLLGQRLWFQKKTAGYSKELKINSNCMGCGACVLLCPMQNLTMKDGKPVPDERCTMCYRCISHCPKQAITLLGKEVVEQTRIENFLR